MSDNKLIIEALQAFGLTEKQANIYLACLNLPKPTIQNIAEKSGIKRTSIYSMLNEMEEKGIIKYTKDGKKTHIKAKSPEHLLESMEERQKKIKQSMPLLIKLQQEQKQDPENPEIIYFRGREGFKNFWKDIFSSNTKEWLIMTSGKEFLSFVSENYIKNNIINKKRKKNIKSRQIISNSSYAREIIKKDIFENRESRIIDHKYKLPVIEIIYENSVAIISSNFDDLIMVIKNKNVAETHRSYFEMIWQFAKS